MNWYKKYASPALFEPKRISPQAKATRFFNYIKSHNVAIEAYHGTSSGVWEAAQQKGMLTAPAARGTIDNEGRHSEDISEREAVHPNADPKLLRGLKQIFLTLNTNYAESYARSKASEDNTQPVLLKIRIPLYAVAEVQGAIFNVPAMYNEFNLVDRIKKCIDAGWEDKLTVEFIQIEIRKKLKLGGIRANEITTYMGLPTKWVTDVQPVDNTGIEDEWFEPSAYDGYAALMKAIQDVPGTDVNEEEPATASGHV